MNITSQIESILFVATKPISLAKLAELLRADETAVTEAVTELQTSYAEGKRGMQLVRHHSKVQFVSHPDNRSAVETYLKEEQFGELTKPGLETLTIIAYRGPITKPELEAIRGVNCSLILRNLMIKGLVESAEDAVKMQTTYTVTFDFVRFLGLNTISELPDFEKLAHHENLEKAVAMSQPGATPPPSDTDQPPQVITA